jgi:hypothetical protein
VNFLGIRNPYTKLDKHHPKRGQVNHLTKNNSTKTNKESKSILQAFSRDAPLKMRPKKDVREDKDTSD